MATQLGFGKVQPLEQKAKESKAKREVAAKKFDQMKQDGLPEFNAYVRVKGKEDWLPVGSMAVERSDKINQALFQQEEEFIKGAIRLYPKLRQQKDNLEYGHRLKQYNDEPIVVAARPKAKSENLLQAAVEEVKFQFSSLFNKQSGNQTKFAATASSPPPKKISLFNKQTKKPLG